METSTKEILEILEQLGQQLTPAGKYVFELAVRQQIIEGVVGFSLIALGLLGGPLLIILGSRGWKKTQDDTYGWLAIGGGVIVVITIIGTLFGAVHLATKVFNPEYAALRDLMATLLGNR